MDLTLHPKQGLAFLSRATEILYGGAAGGGKSHLLRVAALAWCADIPGLQVYLFRRTHPELAKNHLEGAGSFPALLSAWTGAGFVRINLSQNVIRFGNGSGIHLSHCQYPRDLLHYQGAEIHVLMIDELKVALGHVQFSARPREIGGTGAARALPGPLSANSDGSQSWRDRP